MHSRPTVAVATCSACVVISMLAVLPQLAGPAHAQAPVAGFAGTDGLVQRAAIDRQKLVLAGSFERVGRPCGSWVSLDLATGAPNEGGPVVTGDVYEAIPDGEGGFFLAGRIVAVNGIGRQGLAHLREDGSLVPWAPVVVGVVETLALRGDTLFVGGSFTTINGTPRLNLAAVDANSAAVLPWNVSVDGLVQALDLVDDTLYIGGWFRAIAGQPRPGIGAIDVRTAAATNWTLSLIGSAFAQGTPFVTQLVHDGSRMFVGGDFNAVGATQTRGFAVVDRVSGAVEPFAQTDGTQVNRIIIHGGRVYVSGSVSAYTPAGSTYGLFAISRSTLQAVPWVPAFPRYRRIAGALAAVGDRLFMSEEWWDQSYPPQPVCVVDTLDGSAVEYPASLHSSGGSAVLEIAGNRLFAGGPFQMLSSTPRSAIAEIDLSTGQLTNRTFDLFTGVSRVAANAGRVFVWTYGAELVAFDGASIPSWRRPFSYVESMLAAEGHLIVTGQESPGAASERVFDLDPATGSTRAWAPTFANPAGPVSVDALARDDERLYVGGFFQSVNDQSTGGVAAFRWSDLGLEPVSFGSILGVRALAVAPGRLIAVGDVAGRPSPTLAALDLASGALLTWAPLGSAWLDPYSLAGLAVLDDDAYVGYQGPYNPAGQALFNRTSLGTPNWGPGPIATGRAADVVSGAGRLVVVGEFLGFGTGAASSVGVLASPTVDVPWPVGARVSELDVSPDPARDRVGFRWSHAIAPVRLDILDVAGRRVRTLGIPPEQAGLLEWDLRGSDGGRVSAGVHFAVVTARDGSRAMARFVVLR